MSRLDDELKIAFKRKEPSPDFAMRVLARLDEAPVMVEKPSFRERLASIFAPPAFRWAAVGAAAMIVLAVAAMWQFAPRRTAVNTTPVTAKESAAPATDNANKEVVKPEATDAETVTANSNSAPVNQGKIIHRKHRSNLAARHVQPKVNPEAEAAKQQVIFALQIANSAMNDVQRAIQQDSQNLKP